MASDDGGAERALADLVSELAGVAQSPAFVDPVVLGRLDSAFGRVRDLAPDVYGSDRSIERLHFEASYFSSEVDEPESSGFKFWPREDRSNRVF